LNCKKFFCVNFHFGREKRKEGRRDYREESRKEIREGEGEERRRRRRRRRKKKKCVIKRKRTHPPYSIVFFSDFALYGEKANESLFLAPQGLKQLAKYCFPTPSGNGVIRLI